jgi:hypothetical protein
MLRTMTHTPMHTAQLVPFGKGQRTEMMSTTDHSHTTIQEQHHDDDEDEKVLLFLCPPYPYSSAPDM